MTAHAGAPDDVEVGVNVGGVIVLRIARPDSRNALRHQTMQELADAIALRMATPRCDAR